MSETGVRWTGVRLELLFGGQREPHAPDSADALLRFSPCMTRSCGEPSTPAPLLFIACTAWPRAQPVLVRTGAAGKDHALHALNYAVLTAG